MKIVKKQNNDLFARMELVIDQSSGAVMYDADGNPYWIEFWAENARACRDKLIEVAAKSYTIVERREKRSREQTTAEASSEIKELIEITQKKLAYRVKDWYLPNVETGEADTSPTVDKALAVFADNDHDLRICALDFVQSAPFTSSIEKPS